MSPLARSVLVFLGAGLGGTLRFWISEWLRHPYGTLSVNLTGSFFIGLVLGTLRDDPWRWLLVAGFLGGFTTFSAFSNETYRMVAEDRLRDATAYVLVSVLGGIAATAAGWWLSRLLAPAG